MKKDENVHMQALHCKLDVDLVQIPRYNCSKTDCSFCEDSPSSRTPPSTRVRVSPSDPFSLPHYFFHSAAPRNDVTIDPLIDFLKHAVSSPVDELVAVSIILAPNLS